MVTLNSSCAREHGIRETSYMNLNYARYTPLCKLYLISALLCSQISLSQAALSGEQRIWHTVTILFNGPETSEENAENPFLNYRLNVTFTAPGGNTFIIPGFYAVDGNAAETGAASGNKWAVRFTPNETGNWSYFASFRTGEEVAINPEQNAGTPISFDGTSGNFTITHTDKSLPDNRAKGRLNYVGHRYPKFEGTNTYFIKAGADSPENLLAHEDFDNAVTDKAWTPHLEDWNMGDPVWKGDKGKGLIGAINYLASKGMNAYSFNIFNLDDPKTNNGGGEKTIWPWSSTDINLLEGSGAASIDSRMRYDVSKLEQWEIVFSHGESKGMFMHFKTQERGNLKLLDEGLLGVQRKLYYREIIARFGHHLALNWNLGEEFHIYNADVVNSLSAYIKEVDPYDHLVVLHSYPGQQENLYRPLVGTTSGLTGVSLQMDINLVHLEVKQWLDESKINGQQWIVSNDEQGHWKIGVTVDEDFNGDHGTQPDNRDAVRQKILWGTLMAGGFGSEYYFGTETGETDWLSENWRSRATKWEDAKIALDFFDDYLDFWKMETNDDLTSGTADYCLALPGSAYAIYLPNGGSTHLDLNNFDGNYTVLWYDPRNGGGLINGSVTNVMGGASVNIGFPPDNPDLDWVALIKKEENTVTNVTGITVSPKSLFLNKGDNAILNSQISPSNASNQTIAWSTDNSGIAIVDDKGKVTAISKGITNITLRSEDGNFTDTAIVTVEGVQELIGISNFTIVDAHNDADLLDIAPDMSINLDKIHGKDLNIRANWEAINVESVAMNLSGPINGKWIENTTPYTLFGHISGDYLGQKLLPGSYSLSAVAYGGDMGEGRIVKSVSIQFTIVDPGDDEEEFISIPSTNDILVSGYSGFDWSGIKLHPNPANGFVHAEALEPSTAISQIHIYDMEGSLVSGYSKANDLLIRDGLYRVATSTLPAGVYLVKIYTDSHYTYHYRLVVRNE